MSDVLLKKVDPKLYARLKAEAALRGETVGEAFNEAVRVWLTVRQRRDYERERDVEEYSRIKGQLMKHPREYFVIARGTYLGHFPTLTEVFKLLKENETTKALIVRPQPSGEWLAGSLEG